MTRSASASASAPSYSRAIDAPEHPRRIPHDPIIHVLGNRLHTLRLRAGLTQLGLSAKSGLDRSFISDMERGRKSATVVTLNTLAQTFKMTLAELFDGVETATTTTTTTQTH